MGHLQINNSKYLTRLLRHSPELESLAMDKAGWVKIDDLVKTGLFTADGLLDIAREDQKGRFQIEPDRIRAVSGHSIDWVNPGLIECTEVPDILYHGTSREAWQKIQESGEISKMSRNYVHLTTDLADARKVGARHGSVPCVLVLSGSDLLRDGWPFWQPQGLRYYFTGPSIPVTYVKNVLW